MTVNLNQVALTGNLTRDPALLTLPSGHIICEMQLACHHRSRDELTGLWREWPDYFTIRAFGFQARTAHRHLARGFRLGVTGRLSSRRTHGDRPRSGDSSGSSDFPRREIEIVADAVQFLGRPRGR